MLRRRRRGFLELIYDVLKVLEEKFIKEGQLIIHDDKEVYGIDITDRNGFFVINSYVNDPEHSAWLIFNELKIERLIEVNDNGKDN